MMARAGMIALALLAGGIAAAPAQDRIHLHTNETEIGEVLRDGGLAIDDPLAVFGAVLKNLPERVQVYPTENYFYFRFTQNGVVYAGNIRLAAADRDQGKVNFAYNEQPTDWNADPKNRHAVLGAEQGVTVEKAAPLTYRVTHAAKTVTFVLNDLSGVKPPPEMLRPDETFLGPVFDESGIRFFLVFNSRLKIFHFVLDETTPVADQFDRLEGQRADPDRQAHRLCVLSIRRPENPDRRQRTAIAAQHLSRWAVRPACRRISSKARRCARRSSPPIRASKARSTGSAILPTAPAAI